MGNRSCETEEDYLLVDDITVLFEKSSSLKSNPPAGISHKATQVLIMDELVQKALKEVQSKTRSSVPWKLNEPWKQPIHRWSLDEGWKPEAEPTMDSSITTLALYSWNIDFMLPFAASRMSKAIRHLQDMTSKEPQDSTATVIYLQECVDSDVELICAHPWVRETFAPTDLDKSNWQSGHYGTVTLVDRRLPVLSCYRIHYSETVMERDVLIVDVKINGQSIRTCNTHLESLALEPPRRIPQLKLVAEKMHEQGIDGAVAAGDFNAIQDFDRTLHSSNGLKDAYLELGGEENDASGHTWGQQAATKLRKQFGTSRMDKVYFCGNVEAKLFEKFGADVFVEDEDEREQIVALGFDQPWITDHLGVKAVFHVPRAKASL